VTKHLLQIYRILFEEYGAQHWWPADTRDEVIIGAILTQNTNWKNVEKAISNLKKKQLLSLSALSPVDIAMITDCIRAAGHYNQKAERLKLVSNALKEYIVPPVSNEFRAFLLSLKGIGPETADSILLYAYNLPYFVVDTYTKRIFSRLGIIGEQSNYSYFQGFFHRFLEPTVQLFNEYHALIVRHAKLHCRKSPQCANCPLQDICEYALNKGLT